jgi:hypothetical protein
MWLVNWLNRTRKESQVNELKIKNINSLAKIAC